MKRQTSTGGFIVSKINNAYKLQVALICRFRSSRQLNESVERIVGTAHCVTPQRFSVTLSAEKCHIFVETFFSISINVYILDKVCVTRQPGDDTSNEASSNTRR